MNRLYKFKPNQILFVLFSLLFIATCTASEESSLRTKILGYGTVIKATVKHRSAAVRSGPSETSSLIGYVPGATRIDLFPYSDKNGWVQVELNWMNKTISWIKRTDIAIGIDYIPFEGQWPLSYILEEEVHGNEDPIGIALIFSPDNKCGTNKAKTLMSDVVNKYKISLDRVRCQVLWEVPETSLVYSNPNGQMVDIWFNKKTKNIYFNSLVGGALIYGYRNGKTATVETNCKPGKSIACELSEEIKPSISPKMDNPLQNIQYM